MLFRSVIVPQKRTLSSSIGRLRKATSHLPSLSQFIVLGDVDEISSSFTAGSLWLNSAILSARTCAKMESVAPILIVPVAVVFISKSLRSAPSSNERASSTCLKMSLPPDADNTIPLCVRVNSETPVCVSSCLIACDTAGWEI